MGQRGQYRNAVMLFCYKVSLRHSFSTIQNYLKSFSVVTNSKLENFTARNYV